MIKVIVFSFSIKLCRVYLFCWLIPFTFTLITGWWLVRRDWRRESNFTEPWLCNEATKIHSPSSYLFQLNTSSAPCYLLQVFWVGKAETNRHLYFAAWSISFAIRASKSSSLSKDSNFLLLWSKITKEYLFSKVNVKIECGTFQCSNILYLPIRLSISCRFFFSCCKILIISSYNLYPEWSPNANLYFWSTPISYESTIKFGNTNI